LTAAYPDFLQARCTRYRYRYSECRRCADACPHDAIGLSDEGAGIDGARCQNCGLCASACRTGAWNAANVPRVELLKQAIKAPQWSFACAPSGAAADAIVPCLGALDATMLAYLGKRGIPVELRGSEHCATCAHGARGAAQMDAHLEAAAMLREASGETWAAVTVAAAAPERRARADGFAPGRRQLFRRLVGRAATEVLHAAEPAVVSEPVPDKAIRAARTFVTEQRELMQIIARARERGCFLVREHEALPLMKLVLADGCTSCEACFRACPTGALQVRETDTAWSLTFKLDHCVACEACLEVCKPAVLHPVPEFDVAPGAGEVALRVLNKQRCSRCDRAFVSPAPASMCGICADDEDAFAAIYG
jgi:ferredoxin